MTSASTLFMPGAALGGTATTRAGTSASPSAAPSRGFSQALRQAQAQPQRDAQRPRERDIADAREREDAPRAAEPEREETRRKPADEPVSPELSAQDLVLAFAALPGTPAAAAADATAPADGVPGSTDPALAAAAGALAGDAPAQPTDPTADGKPEPGKTTGVTKKEAPLAVANEPAAVDGAAIDQDDSLPQTPQEAQAAPAVQAVVPQRTPETPAAPTTLAALAGSHTAAPTGAATHTSAAATLTRQVDVPADSAEFPDALAAQVGYLVRDGVQQARLTLNPAEMGPVTVQIAVQGQQAQVDFAVTSAATRAALENSLSHLAAALQEAGLTLSGGGVSQQHEPRQPPGQGRPDQPGGRALHGSDEAPAVQSPTAVPSARRIDGRLDLYA